jgi:hypothetical protein
VCGPSVMTMVWILRWSVARLRTANSATLTNTVLAYGRNGSAVAMSVRALARWKSMLNGVPVLTRRPRTGAGSSGRRQHTWNVPCEPRLLSA